MTKNEMRSENAAALVLGLLLCWACGPGGGTKPTHTVGGTISGLTGTVVLQDNGGDDLSVTASGTFTFAKGLAAGATYQVSIRTQPATVVCVVTQGSGTIGSADITNVSVVCAASGSLDTSFATGGMTLIPPGEATAVAVQADGKIVVLAVGTNTNGSSFSLLRLNSDGSVDTSFGSQGKALGNLGGESLSSESPNALVIQSDGKLVVAGRGSAMVNGSPSLEFALTRFDTAGTLDTSFGTSGKVLTDFGNGFSSDLWSVALQNNDQIVAVGTTPGGGTDYNFALARYSPDGALDSTFGTGGKVVTDFSQGGQDNAAKSLVIQPDGKVVVAGWTQPSSSVVVLALARYTASGGLDSSFGSGGQITNYDLTGDNADLVHVGLQADGKIVVGGNVNSGSGDFILTRYDTSGALDVGFGSNGLVVTDVNSGQDRMLAMRLQSDGKILAAGFSAYQNRDAFGLVRYRSDGSLDPSFGPGGKVLVDFGLIFADCTALAIQTDGNIVLAGGATDLTTHYAAIARVTP